MTDPTKAAREALGKIARQKKTTELETEYDVEVADFEGGYDAFIDLARAALGGLPAEEAEAHPDDTAVDAFAAIMKAKLAKARAKGRSGWEDREQCTNDYLSRLLRDHVEKGDPLDVANIAMFLHQREEPIAAQDADITRLSRALIRATARVENTEAALAETRERLEKQEEHTFRVVAENDKLRELADAAEELLEVSNLRGEADYLDPYIDPGLWTSRRNDAWGALEIAIAARAALTGDAQGGGK